MEAFTPLKEFSTVAAAFMYLHLGMSWLDGASSQCASLDLDFGIFETTRNCANFVAAQGWDNVLEFPRRCVPVIPV